jgi:hypothetical protein
MIRLKCRDGSKASLWVFCPHVRYYSDSVGNRDIADVGEVPTADISWRGCQVEAASMR